MNYKIEKRFLPALCIGNRPKNTLIDTIIIHSMRLPSVTGSLITEADLAWHIFKTETLSAHYLITSTGRVFQFADENHLCFHAGKSIMPLPDIRQNVNDFSIGIELIENKNGSFSDLQYASLAKLCFDISNRRGIPFSSILGHQAIAGHYAVSINVREYYEMKTDPGPHFNWKSFENLFYEI